MRHIGCLLVAGAMLISASAQAGRNGSQSKIRQAAASGSVDSIVAQVERAEKLACLGCIDEVMKLMDHQSAKVRDVAGWWLGKRGVRNEVIAIAQARFAGQDPVAARNAADVLGGMRDFTTVPALSSFLGKPLDEASGMAAAHALGEIGHPTGLVALKAAAGSNLAGVRSAALAAMRNLRAPLGKAAPADASAILAQLSDADAGVREQAAMTAGYVRDAASVSALANLATSDSSAQVRKAAVWAIGEIGAYNAIDGSGTAALTAAQRDADALVRSVATGALGRLK
jgi:HEAT repeat protein